MNREMEIEVNRWRLLCEEAMKVGIDPNKPQFNRVFRAIALWGESLVALRQTQTTEVVAKAATMAFNNWQDISKKKGVS